MGDILFLAHRIPFPPDRGDKIRAHHLLRRLAQIAPVHVGCLAETAQDRAAEPELARIAASHCLAGRGKPLAIAGMEALLLRKPVSLTAFANAQLRHWVCRTIETQKIATIFVFSGQMGQYVPEDFPGRVIIDLCDVDSVKFEDYAVAGERVWLNRREGRLLAREEERLAHRAHATLLISENEREVLLARLQNPAGPDIRAIGNGIDAGYFDPAGVTPQEGITERPGPHFVLTGQMDYRPNEAAAIWAAEQFLPRLRQRFPDAQFHVVGRNPTDPVRRLDGRGGVKVWGEVPDVRPFLAAADMVLAPLAIARGVQNKVLEAMAMARPVMVSPGAATGIGARDGQDWIVAPLDAEAMVRRFETLWIDRPRLRGLGMAARRFVLDHHGWDAMLAPLDPLLLPSGEVRDAA